MLKWARIEYLKDIWYKLTFQNILNIWKRCVEMAEVLYINKHHFKMIKKLQTGEQNEWAKTSI
jgi:hypothetical protein